MWSTVANRRELVELFLSQRSYIPNAVEESHFLPHMSYDLVSQVQLVWRDNPYLNPALPSLILVDRPIQREFFAWALTYLKSIRPMTAYCRVLEANMARQILEQDSSPRLGRFEDACLGLILGEAIGYLPGPFDVRALSPRMCTATFSFAVAKALAIGWPVGSLSTISESWPVVRMLAQRSHPLPNISDYMLPWVIVLNLLQAGIPNSVIPKIMPEHAILLECCRSIAATGEIDSGVWKLISSGLPMLESIHIHLLGPRERRVIAIDQALLVLRSDLGRPQEIKDFIAGYLLSRLAPGTFDHAALLFERGFNSSLQWYGLCAGLQDNSSLKTYLDGLGRRVLRDVLRSESILDSPRCDISFQELEVVLGEQVNLPFRTGSIGNIEIEIAPCISTFIRWPSRNESSSDPGPASSLPKESMELLSELQVVLSHAKYISEKIQKVFDGSSSKEDLVDRKKRRPSKKMLPGMDE